MGTDEIGVYFCHYYENGNLFMVIIPLNRSPIKLGVTAVFNYPVFEYFFEIPSGIAKQCCIEGRYGRCSSSQTHNAHRMIFTS